MGGENYTTKIGTQIVIWQSHGGKNQRWKYECGRLVNPTGGLVMEVDSNGLARLISNCNATV